MMLADKHSITRRDLIRGAATGMISLAVGNEILGAQPTPIPPNIVFILADDLGYADVSCYGRPDLNTPNIDRIAARGMRFLQAYANSAVCSATRTALITGRYQYRLRLGLEEPLTGKPNVGLPPEHPTLPSLLKKAGYSSTLVGKWHLGVLPKFGPLKSGYDHFYGFRDGGSQKTYQKMIEEMDRQIGRVLQALDANGLTENTIVIFTSDNGGERFADTWPFTGKKTELLEGGLRIPALISWPARIPQGRTTEQVAISVDWMPTLLAAAGVAPDPSYPVDGMNLLPQLTQNAAPVSRKLFWRYKANAPRALRDGDYKFLKILENTFLFNVVEDPLERANLKERQKDVFQRLVREWNEWNATMLPEIKESYTHSFDGEELADHYGAKKPD